jgi:hypothetical protein
MPFIGLHPSILVMNGMIVPTQLPLCDFVDGVGRSAIDKAGLLENFYKGIGWFLHKSKIVDYIS